MHWNYLKRLTASEYFWKQKLSGKTNKTCTPKCIIHVISTFFKYFDSSFQLTFVLKCDHQNLRCKEGIWAYLLYSISFQLSLIHSIWSSLDSHVLLNLHYHFLNLQYLWGFFLLVYCLQQFIKVTTKPKTLSLLLYAQMPRGVAGE